jgi:hypothetical protein
VDWFLIVSIVACLGAIALGLVLFFRRPFGGARHTTDYVANRGMAQSVGGDGRRDTVERHADTDRTSAP